MHKRWIYRARFLFALVCAGAIAGTGAAPSRKDSAAFEKNVKPFLVSNCLTCHNAKAKLGGLDLGAYPNADAALKDDTVWEKVLEKLRTHQMPPPGLPAPKPGDLTLVTTWIDTQLDRLDRARKPDPGRVTAHRLNRYEYNNTIHDLLGVEVNPADDFQADDSGYGFDNIGDVLSLSPLLMEKYLTAAETVAKLAIVTGPPPKPSISRYRIGQARATVSSGGTMQVWHRFPVEADYDLRFNVGGKRPDEIWKATITFDDEPRKTFEMIPNPQKPPSRQFEVRVAASPGDHVMKIRFHNDANKPNEGMLVDYLEVRGPFIDGAPKLPESHKRIFLCGHANGQHTPECKRLILSDLARRAWRRPVTDAEVARLAGFVDMAQQEGDSFEQGIRVALQAVLVSPHFLFRIEQDPKPDDPSAVHQVSDFEMASRLSYFLWSSMPDEELFRAAAGHTLRQPAALEAQVRRMLKDPKSSRFVENFTGQWLELRNLDSVKPDPVKFAGFDDDLRQSMKRETTLFFSSILREDKSILDLIDGKYTFLNDRLARHYGIPDVTGSEFRRVELDGTERSGVLTQASILTVTSYPNRTSPVLRGKFLLENILGTPPPPPPPDAGILDESQVNVNGTVREQFEKHRSQPTCAACHVRMDPLGFAFENYDAIGRWRTQEGRFPVDSSGVLPDGKKFAGPAGLKVILKQQQISFAQCLTEKLLVYGLGRGLEPYDKPAVKQICRKIAANDFRISSLILEIVQSMPFQMRRGDGKL